MNQKVPKMKNKDGEIDNKVVKTLINAPADAPYWFISRDHYMSYPKNSSKVAEMEEKHGKIQK